MIFPNKGLINEATETRIVHYILHQEGAAEQAGESVANRAEKGIEGVAEDVAKEDDFFGKPFGAGGGDIFRLEDIEDIGPKNAESASDTAQAENQSGQDEVVGDVEEFGGGGKKVVIQRGKSADGKPTGAGSHPNGKKGEKEFGNGQSKVGGGGGEAIDPTARSGGSQNGEGNG